jgi:hypothetical protein
MLRDDPYISFSFARTRREQFRLRAPWLLVWAALLSGCSQSSGDGDTLPELDRNDSLTGPDTDNNGVRDDIDTYISRRYPKTEQAKAARQEARALQKALQVPAGDVAAAKAVVRDMERATVCTYSQFPAGGSVEAAQVGLEIERLTTNTKLRLKAYLAFNKMLDGTSSRLPRGRTCE